MELAARQQAKEEESKLHPMFRGRSESEARSRSASVVDEIPPRKKRKTSSTVPTISEEVVEIMDSDDEVEIIDKEPPASTNEADKAQ